MVVPWARTSGFRLTPEGLFICANKVNFILSATKEYLKRESVSTNSWFQFLTFLIWCTAIILRIIFVQNTPDVVYAPILGQNKTLLSKNDMLSLHNMSYMEILQNFNENFERSRITDTIRLLQQLSDKSKFYDKLYANTTVRPYKSPGHFFGSDSFYFFLFDPAIVSPMYASGINK